MYKYPYLVLMCIVLGQQLLVSTFVILTLVGRISSVTWSRTICVSLDKSDNDIAIICCHKSHKWNNVNIDLSCDGWQISDKFQILTFIKISHIRCCREYFSKYQNVNILLYVWLYLLSSLLGCFVASGMLLCFAALGTLRTLLWGRFTASGMLWTYLPKSCNYNIPCLQGWEKNSNVMVSSCVSCCVF